MQASVFAGTLSLSLQTLIDILYQAPLRVDLPVFVLFIVHFDCTSDWSIQVALKDCSTRFAGEFQHVLMEDVQRRRNLPVGLVDYCFIHTEGIPLPEEMRLQLTNDEWFAYIKLRQSDRVSICKEGAVPGLHEAQAAAAEEEGEEGMALCVRIFVDLADSKDGLASLTEDRMLPCVYGVASLVVCNQ